MFELMQKVTNKIDHIKDVNILMPDIFNILIDYFHLYQISIKFVVGQDIVVKYISGATYDKESDSQFLPFVKEGCENASIDGNFTTCIILIRTNLTLDLRRTYPLSAEELKNINIVTSVINLILRNEQLYIDCQNNENLRVVGMLRATTAHDISNLLSIVEIYLNLLKGEIGSDSVGEGYIESISNELQRVDSLTKDMMDISKQKLVLSKSVFLASKIFHSLKRNIKASVKDTAIELNFNLNKDFEINADENRLFRVLTNLTNNAIDALNEKGKIYIKFKKIENISVFIILDTGKGMSHESLESLFTPFFTQGKVKGNGLGLVIVKDIVAAHGGKIYVRSMLNKYTCFIIRIPD